MAKKLFHIGSCGNPELCNTPLNCTFHHFSTTDSAQRTYNSIVEKLETGRKLTERQYKIAKELTLFNENMLTEARVRNDYEYVINRWENGNLDEHVVVIIIKRVNSANTKGEFYEKIKVFLDTKNLVIHKDNLLGTFSPTVVNEMLKSIEVRDTLLKCVQLYHIQDNNTVNTFHSEMFIYCYRNGFIDISDVYKLPIHVLIKVCVNKCCPCTVKQVGDNVIKQHSFDSYELGNLNKYEADMVYELTGKFSLNNKSLSSKIITSELKSIANSTSNDKVEKIQRLMQHNIENKPLFLKVLRKVDFLLYETYFDYCGTGISVSQVATLLTKDKKVKNSGRSFVDFEVLIDWEKGYSIGLTRQQIINAGRGLGMAGADYNSEKGVWAYTMDIGG